MGLELHFEGGGILDLHFPFVVEPRSGNARMSKPILHLSNIGTVAEGLVAEVARKACGPSPSCCLGKRE